MLGLHVIGQFYFNVNLETSIVSSAVRLPPITLLSVPKIPLNEACSGGDLCEDANAACRRGLCLCTDGFFESNRRCGKDFSVLFMTFKHFNGKTYEVKSHEMDSLLKFIFSNPNCLLTCYTIYPQK